MSGNFYGYTKEKFLESPYKDLDFQANPYETNNRFSIYVPTYKDRVAEIIEKDKMRRSDTFGNSSRLRTKLANDIRQSHAVVKETKDHGDVREIGETKNRVKIREPEVEENTNYIDEAHAVQEEQGRPHTSNTDRNYLRASSLQHTNTQRKMRTLRDQLYFDERTQTIPKSTLKNNIIERIIMDEATISKNPNLVNSIFKLKSLNLLNVRNPKVNRFKGIGKAEYVYNDYHTRHTNPGFSRNKLGTFFER
eukprot:TRINITY_DN2399_c0_g1_i7.p2 TRINITY_DN2399_c0_g1~~TRINITY_DN2399_c0_g1_i7.p2  ORF type:complete len:250 (-),score=52.87 TRINITY_DN2399_c0_g1_i7:1313-2062(-)